MVANRSLSVDEKVQSEVEKNNLNQLYIGLQRYTNYLTKNKWVADDLVQEAVLRAIEKYQPTELNSALLNKIAYHYWVDTIRKRKREIFELSEEIVEGQTAANMDGLMDTVNLLMDGLTPKQAVTFILKEAFSYQAKEIAELLNSTEMAIKSLLYRAKKRLKKPTRLQSIDSFWIQEDKEMLCDLLYTALKANDPSILIESISNIPSLAEAPQLLKQKHSGSPLDLYCIAA